MRHLLRNSAIGALAFMVTGTAAGGTYHTFDPVTMAKGGTGVAFTVPGAASLLNPASLSAMPEGSGLGFGISGSGRAFDQDDLIDEIDAFQDAEYVDTLDADIADAESALEQFANTGSSSDRQAAATALASTSDSTRALDDGLQDVAGRPAEAEFAAAFVGSRPSRTLGIGLSFSAWGTVSGTSRYDDTFLTGVASDLDVCAQDLAANNPCDANNLTFVTDTDGDNVPDTIDLDPENDLNSRVFARGLLVSEVGLTLSRAFDLGGQTVALGVTPKSQTIRTIDYVATVDDADGDEIDSEAYREDYSDFNLDLGAHTRFGPIATGITVRNVLAREYETALGNDIQMDPQARAGVAYDAGPGTIGADLDLTENDSSGFADPTRFLSVGGELDVIGWLQLRAGYRWNTAGAARDTASIGLGLSPFGVGHFDLALARGDGEVGVSSNLSLTF
jgi:hypothetical protein